MSPIETHLRRRITALNEHLKSVPPITSWCAEVSTDGGLTWATNAIRLATEAEAKAYGQDLMGRWSAVTGVVASPRRGEEPNRVWEGTELRYLPDLGHTS